ncbi:MAG TPA: DUF6785 family protein [Sumerlaeia bacterium]|nr:DUF6785 family protein [Sumerlaeia bacterium]
MTIRAIIFGLLCASAISAFSYFNDQIMVQTPLIGNNMPISVYGALICFVLVCNPLLARCGKRFAFSGRELAVVVALTLGVCSIPHAGLFQPFTASLIMPYHFERTVPGWEEQGVVEMTPKRMLPDITQDEERVLGGFLQGLAVGRKHISLADVPWGAWKRPLLFWLPIILGLWIGLIGLSVVVHRQWSDHEHLPYPVAKFADSLMPREGNAVSSVLKSRLFWLGAVPVFAIYVNNYAYQWWPRYLPLIPTSFDFSPLGRLSKVFERGGGPGLLSPSNLKIYFTVVGFAFFLPTDVSLGLGVGPYFWAYLVGLLAGYGISLGTVYAGGFYIGLVPYGFMLAGAYLGLFLVLAYTGRHYYLSVCRKALLLPSAERMPAESVWGARVFLIAFASFVGQLVAVGLDWQISLIYSCLVVMMFLVMARILAETGLFFIQPYFFPCALVWGIFGSQALGPETLLILFMVSVVLLIDPRETIMAFTVNSLKMLDLRRVNIGKSSMLLIFVLFLGMAIALPVTLYFQYDRGYHYGWSTVNVPRYAFDNVVQTKQRLDSVGALETAGEERGWARFTKASPNGPCLLALVAGLSLVLVFAIGRLRYSKWPLHPVMFLVWSTWPGAIFCASFLLGWFLKAVVSKYGGGIACNKLKPLMIGLIAGEILGGLFPSIVGTIYYFATQEQPKPFSVLPL